MGGSQDLVRTRAAASRRAHSASHHGIDPRKVREADARRMARIGWLVTGGVTLVTGIVLMFVMNTHDGRRSVEQEWEKKLREFRDAIENGDISNPGLDTLNPEKLNRLNGLLAILIKTRNLKEKLTGIESHLGSSPTLEVLGRDFEEVWDAELRMQSEEAGGDLRRRYEAVVKEVTKRYLELLRTAANAAAQATTGEALAPYGPLEDALRTMLHELMANNDAEAVAIHQPMWKQTCSEINGIVARLFNEAYQKRVPWNDLLADDTGWTIASSSSFRRTFSAGLTLVNAPGGQSAWGGLSYKPADKWRDYVLEVEFKLDSGTLIFYTRIGNRMDLEEAPAFWVGAKNATIQIEYGKTYAIVVSTIGSKLTVTGEGISHTEDIESNKSRRGGPGIVAEVGTTAIITKLRARHLR